MREAVVGSEPPVQSCFSQRTRNFQCENSSTCSNRVHNCASQKARRTTCHSRVTLSGESLAVLGSSSKDLRSSIPPTMKIAFLLFSFFILSVAEASWTPVKSKPEKYHTLRIESPPSLKGFHLTADAVK